MNNNNPLTPQQRRFAQYYAQSLDPIKSAIKAGYKTVSAKEKAMLILEYILLAFLVVCAVSVSFSKNLLNSILIFMSYSLVMSIIWILLESPDLAITEAAVGAGVSYTLG